MGGYGATPEYAPSALNETADLLVGSPAEIGALRLNWRTADPALLAVLRKALLADGTDAEFYAFLNTLEPDESLDAGRERVDPVTWGRIPRTYVRLTRDLCMPLPLQDRFIAEADALVPDNPFEVRSLDSGHVRFLIHPGGAAAILAELG